MLQHDRFADDVQFEEYQQVKQLFEGDLVTCANCQDDREADSFFSCPHCHSPLCDDICLHFHLQQFLDCKHGLEVD